MGGGGCLEHHPTARLHSAQDEAGKPNWVRVCKASMENPRHERSPGHGAASWWWLDMELCWTRSSGGDGAVVEMEHCWPWSSVQSTASGQDFPPFPAQFL